MAFSPFEPLFKGDVKGNPDADLADPAKPGGPSDYSDPSPVDAEHVLNLMRSNFPEDAIEWVKRARWIGPVNVPWERIDKDNIDSWASSHQPEAVARFAKDIKAGTGHTNPSILIQHPSDSRLVIVDGHHRALAHHKLNQPVLAYIGNIEPGDRMAAEETHSKQVHSGADPRNKSEVIEPLLVRLEEFWYRRETGLPVSRRDVFKALTDLRDAGRDERMLRLQALDFGWDLDQLDSPSLRAWLCGG